MRDIGWSFLLGLIVANAVLPWTLDRPELMVISIPTTVFASIAWTDTRGGE